MSAILWASHSGIPHAVKNLLDNGATDISVALQLALEQGNKDTIQVLVRHKSCDWLAMLDRERDSEFRANKSRDEVHNLRKQLVVTVSDLLLQDTSLVPREVAKPSTGDGGLPEALKSCMRVAFFAREQSHRNKLRNPTRAEALVMLSTQLQLCAAALVDLMCATEADVDYTLAEGKPARVALNQFLVMEAK
eukprot:3202605-Prymnesium_polylepis.1